jgi:hypothetical protein
MSAEYSDDQYRADYESRYPQFSDYQLSDDMIAEHKWDRPAKSREAQTFESQYQTEQLGIPTYHGCNCGKCPHSEWPRQPRMRKADLDHRERAMQEYAARRCQPPQSVQPPQAVQPPQSGGVVESMTGSPSLSDPTSIMIMLTFIMFIFICYCMKAIIEIKAQLKNQKNNLSAEAK